VNAGIPDSLARLEAAITEACRRAGRNRNEVRLVAVTKTRTPEEVSAAIAAGITDVGENRVQEAAAKRPLVASAARWHLIGNLQTNKAKKAVELFDFVHSVDSRRLAGELDRYVQGHDRNPPGISDRVPVLPVLIEVNTSAEASKHGVTPETAPALVEQLLGFGHLELTGLMTIGPGWAIENPEASRPCFRTLRGLAEDCRRQFAIPLPHLSMGMSSDFAVGIEEGATIIRVGTAIFGPRGAGT